MTARDAHCTDSVAQEAAGSVEAQNVIAGLAADSINTDHAWLGFVQVAARYGWRSAACRAYVIELAKRAAGPA